MHTITLSDGTTEHVNGAVSFEIESLRGQLAEARTSLAALGITGDTQTCTIVEMCATDMLLERTRERDEANAVIKKLRGALTAVVWLAKHDCHLEQTIERVVRLRNDIISAAEAAK